MRMAKKDLIKVDHLLGKISPSGMNMTRFITETKRLLSSKSAIKDRKFRLSPCVPLFLRKNSKTYRSKSE